MRAAVLATVLAFLTSGAVQATAVRSGLYGVATRGPISPVCVVELPCDEPASHVTFAFSRNGDVVGRAVTDVDGRYRVHLPAGLYTVRRVSVTGIDRRLDPNEVRVRPRRFVRVDFSIDTGIR